MSITQRQLRDFHRRQAKITGRRVEWHYEDRHAGRRPVYDRYGRPYRRQRARPYVRRADQRAWNHVMVLGVVLLVVVVALLVGAH
jgi:hypothetical protein